MELFPKYWLIGPPPDNNRDAQSNKLEKVSPWFACCCPECFAYFVLFHYWVTKKDVTLSRN